MHETRTASRKNPTKIEPSLAKSGHNRNSLFVIRIEKQNKLAMRAINFSLLKKSYIDATANDNVAIKYHWVGTTSQKITPILPKSLS